MTVMFDPGETFGIRTDLPEAGGDEWSPDLAGFGQSLREPLGKLPPSVDC